MSDPRPPAEPAPARAERPGNDPLIIAVIVLGAVLLLGILFLALRDGDDGDVVVFDDDTEQPGAAPTPAPSPTPEPTATIEDEEVSPTPEPDPEPTARPTPTGTALPLGPDDAVETEDGEPGLEVAGEGDGTSEPFEHDGGLIIARYAQEDEGELAVRAVPEGSDGDAVELVSDASGERGERAGTLPAGSYRLEVTASAAWRVTLDRPRYTEGSSLPFTVEGNDEVVSDPFETAGGDVRIELTPHDGGSFEVRVLDVDGEEVGAFDSSGGEETVDLEEGLHLLEVRSEGRWTAVVS